MSNETVYRRIAVIDIGKTNAKVVVVDAGTGTEIAAVRTANSVLKSGPYLHYDIDGLWDFIISALKGFVRVPGFDAISITTHGACVAMLADDGNLAMPVLDYEHGYPQAIQNAYSQVRPKFVETFSPGLSVGLNVGAQIHYLKSTFPADFARTATILTYPQYWAFRLTGVAANEVTSLGCHTDLWNPTTQSYSSLVDTLGIRGLMAPVRSAFDALGPVLPALAAALGLTKPVPVYCGIHDSNASLLPHLVENEAPFAVVSTGTWVISFGVGGDLDHLDAKRDALANVDAYGRAVPSARFMGGREFEILAAEIGPASSDAVEAAIEAVIEKGLMLLPNAVEGSGPFPGRRRRWIADHAASNAERLAAVSLYLALMTEACLGLIGAKGQIFVEGPFALNRAYLIALSALTSTDVIALAGSTGTSQGAALLAGIRPIGVADSPPIRAELRGLARYRQFWREAMIS
ncbi:MULTISPECIES: FGGY-family carbohydrate kinase [Rhizobium]|uniref:Carbohydrate kinase n=1 Tax=Rhizobium tropici TaxID=398 RepID=A0A6P1C4Y6_RHITR|nr:MULTISPECIES: FGGY-family carbohydrate kinase [Rhizobium]AGB74375.1 rhamnulokinase RhaK [Rhizobium tropici CIAT 899]MBB4240856.1 sugar (pentulose or hexulose) kinase [Rhizobium tropici]MBB5591727.1 sugar (pentulose or hexulose) kinase [Rhizobium tropici]MBB6490781.1 sugar (pentulose or hexulose) kinase [Rhizobium tropici]NEV12259.1 carbohydrate kinase [Rhizobium tropici]